MIMYSLIYLFTYLFRIVQVGLVYQNILNVQMMGNVSLKYRFVMEL